MTVLVNSVLLMQYGKRFHSRCAGMKKVTPRFIRNFACRKCGGNIGETVEQEEKSCNEVVAVRELTCPGINVSAVDV